jgi:hypothetical protein
VEVVLLKTEGRAGVAEVEIAGCRLSVVDQVSRADVPALPGPVSNPRLEVVTIDRLTARMAGDRAPEERLVHERGWRYRACGEVISIDPPQVDLGPFSVNLDLPVGEDWAIGDLAAIAIDRIILSSHR